MLCWLGSVVYFGADGKVSELRLVAGDPTSDRCQFETLPDLLLVFDQGYTCGEYRYRIVRADVFELHVWRCDRGCLV